MIRNIVFDMGNVVIRFEPDRFMDRAGVTDESDRRLVMNELFRSVEWADMDAGILTEETAEPSIMERFPERLRKAVRQMLYSWAYPPEMIPGMEDLIRSAREAGYGIYLLSNASTAQPAYWAGVPVSGMFDGTMISCDVRVVKPCRRIYGLFTEKFGLNPRECLFIDDAPANVSGAVACGWKGIVFNGDAEELKAKMRALGIAI